MNRFLVMMTPIAGENFLQFSDLYFSFGRNLRKWVSFVSKDILRCANKSSGGSRISRRGGRGPRTGGRGPPEAATFKKILHVKMKRIWTRRGGARRARPP